MSLEEAFKKATGQDMDHVLERYQSDQISDLEYVLKVARRVQSRQDNIKPLLPLASDKEGYQASFEFVRIQRIIEEIEIRLTQSYMREGKTLLAQSIHGDKRDAREAYRYFTRARAISDHPEIPDYIDSARNLGITRILVDLTNVSGDWMAYYIDRHLELNVHSMNSFWTTYYLEEPDQSIDYRVDAVIRSVDISPEQINENKYRDVKDIEDGFEYVLDANGNVLKDSLGNDVKVPRIIQVKARVIEVFQQKDLWIKGDLDIFTHDGRLVNSRPFEVFEKFEHYSSSFRGDRRALSKESKRKIGNHPAPFPTDEHMILQALEKLSPAIHDQLRKMTIT